MDIYFGVLFFLLGSVFASFYGVVATRLPEGKSLLGRSHCNHCNHQLSWYELIPIFSYLFLRGKCHHCHKKLPIYEPIIELFMGIFFSISYFYYGFSYELWMSLILISLFVLIYISDFRYMIILDSPLIISSILIFFLKWIYFGIQEALISLFSGAILFLIFLGIGFLGSKIFKREALGGGDIKLAFVMGESVGILYAIIGLILSTFLALPYATFTLLNNEDREVPFGPFLISALCMVFVFYEKFTTILKFIMFH